MSKNKIIPYNPRLKEFARKLRKNSTLSEVLLWQKIKNLALDVQFHRQVPLLEYIVDFYCHELQLAIEIDGNSHEFKYEYDSKRQGSLEKEGVTFIRFLDSDLKNNIFSVLLILQETVEVLVTKKNLTDNTPQVPSRGQSPIKASEEPKKPSQEDNVIGFSFPKKEKLKNKKLIEQLFKEGKSITNFPLKLIYLNAVFEDEVKIKTGVIAPKKNFKNAVQRNRIKRLLREAYRLNKPIVFNNIEGSFAFMILYLGKETPNHQLVDEKMKGLLKNFMK